MHPNLQVENEETIEALSARTKALLDRIQQRFYFVASITAFSAVPSVYRAVRRALLFPLSPPLTCSRIVRFLARFLAAPRSKTPRTCPLHRASST
ncbi:hypothetical protein FAZ95_21625 [Trinickia violacea]|uniref:Uncharacterized protein n=1 Tax=Trinickia violacea TaxID=2571746 RepID=A0A4P8IQY7_9BURK|nr:hypothetical protein FAZ95_21625 [Trinickia violacea]